MPQAFPMSRTCRDVMLDQDWGMGPARDVDPVATTSYVLQGSLLWSQALQAPSIVTNDQSCINTPSPLLRAEPDCKDFGSCVAQMTNDCSMV